MDKYREAKSYEQANQSFWNAPEKLEVSKIKFSRAKLACPQSPHSYLRWGYGLQKLNKNEEALSALEIAIRINPHDFKLPFIQGLCFGNLNRHEEAAQKYAKSALLRPENSAVHRRWARALVKANKIEEALHIYAKMANLNPQGYSAWYEWGVCLAQLGRHEEAVEKYKQALSLNCGSMHSIVHESCISSLIELGKNEEAEKMRTQYNLMNNREN